MTGFGPDKTISLAVYPLVISQLLANTLSAAEQIDVEILTLIFCFLPNF